MKLEAIVIPVSDVERVKEFYRKRGWRQDVTPPARSVPVHCQITSPIAYSG